MVKISEKNFEETIETLFMASGPDAPIYGEAAQEDSHYCGGILTPSHLPHPCISDGGGEWAGIPIQESGWEADQVSRD